MSDTPTTTDEWLAYLRWELQDFIVYLRDSDHVTRLSTRNDLERLIERVCNPDNLPAAWADYRKERDA